MLTRGGGRYDYSPEDSILTIKAMPGSLHNTVANTSAELLVDMRELGFLSRVERSCISADVGTDVELPTMSSLSRRGGKSKSKSGTACKQPDVAYYFIDKSTSIWRRDVFPRVVFEVALTQKHETLIEDAKDWLIRSQGMVKVVVLINLHEGPIPTQPTDIDPGNEPKPDQVISVTEDAAEIDHNDADADDLTPEGPEQAIPPGPTSPATSQSSTAQEYVEDLLRDPPSTWVGPICGTIQLYRYDPNTGTACCDGPKYVSSHPSIPGPQLTRATPGPVRPISAAARAQIANL